MKVLSSLVLSGAIALAQGPITDKVMVNFPNPVVVSGTTLPAGEYTIRQLPSSNNPRVLEYGDRVYRYRVESLSIVQPRNKELLRPSPDAVLTLVTCYPFYFVGPAPRRFIVRAVLTGKEQQQHKS